MTVRPIGRLARAQWGRLPGHREGMRAVLLRGIALIVGQRAEGPPPAGGRRPSRVGLLYRRQVDSRQLAAPSHRQRHRDTRRGRRRGGCLAGGPKLRRVPGSTGPPDRRRRGGRRRSPRGLLRGPRRAQDPRAGNRRLADARCGAHQCGGRPERPPRGARRQQPSN